MYSTYLDFIQKEKKILSLILKFEKRIKISKNWFCGLVLHFSSLILRQ